jgi:hypothetical protein
MRPGSLPGASCILVATPTDRPLGLAHRTVRAAPRPEAVAVLGEGRIEERLQHL